jgi:hypothetical protein
MKRSYSVKEINEILNKNGIRFSFEELLAGEEDLLWWNTLTYEWKILVIHNHNNQYRRFSNTPIDNYDLVLRQISNYNRLQLKGFIKEVRELVQFFCSFNGGPMIGSLLPISHLANIKHLSAHNIYPKNFEAIKWLNNLTFIDLAGSDIESVEVLSKLYHLEHVNISRTPLKSLRGLENLHNLKHLNFSSTAIDSLAPLRNLINLEYLSFFQTGVKDLLPLSELNNLKTLYCYSTRVNCLEGIKHLENLELFNLSNTGVTDFLPIKNNHNLKRLVIKGMYNLPINLARIQELLPAMVIEQ